MEIHKAGGGIGFTVQKTKEASEEELVESLIERLGRMMRSGTTLAEAKSGYGLEMETEIKMLRVSCKVRIHVVVVVVVVGSSSSIQEATCGTERNLSRST